ncbi:CS1-pili formation C-terminal domain-containing protein [Photobacterium damselae subsp. damselae]
MRDTYFSKNKITIFLILFCNSSIAHKIPAGFEGFYEYQESQVIFQLNNNSIILNANIKIDSVKIKDNDKDKLKKFLLDNNVKKNKVDEILLNLKNSSMYAKSCGNKDIDVFNCHISDFGYYFSYNDHKLYFLLDSMFFYSGLKSLEKETYHKEKTINITAVNNVSYNGYINNYGGNVNITDNITTKLLYGYVSSDVEINLANDSNVDINSLYYDYDYDDKFIRFGYYNNNNYFFDNQSDLYNQDVSSEKVEITYGNSLKLLDSPYGTNRTIYFYMPFDGWIELIRDNKSIAFKSVNLGNTTISYNELPKGKYNLKIIIHNKSNTKKQEKDFYISNIDSANNTDGFNYKLSFGKFLESNDLNDNLNHFSDDNIVYINGMVSKSISDKVNIGYNGYLTANDIYNKFGLYFNSENISFDLGYGFTNNNTNMLESNISFYGFNASYKKSNYIDDDILGYKIFGGLPKELISVNYSKSISYINYFLSYNKNKNQVDNNENYMKNNELTFGASYTGDNGIDYNLSYTNSRYSNKWSDGKSDNLLSFLINIPFDNCIDYTNSISSSDGYGLQVENTITANNIIHSIDGVESSIYLKQNYYSKHSINSLGASVSYSNQYYSLNSYADFSDDGSYSITANGMSSFNFSNNKIDISNNTSNSILKIDVENVNDHSAIYGKIIVNNITDAYKQTYDLKYSNTLPLIPYKRYEIFFDTELEDYVIKGKSKISLFSLPGKIVNNDLSLHKIKSFIVSFEDFNGNRLDSPKCNGDGCNGISEIGDGVYSISLISGLDYKVTSQNEVCLFPNIIDSINKNFGVRKCFPHVVDDGNDKMIVKSEFGDKKNKYEYLGMIDNTYVNNEIKNNNHLKLVTVDSNTYIFKILSESNDKLDIAINEKIQANIPKFTYNYEF